jgi:hypothetical protein
MSIVVSCKCGKRFKAKNAMAGKRVRCPGCKDPLRVPGDKTAGGAGEAGVPVIDEEAALLKFEEAQKRKAATAEAEAAFREEKNKLIASYDQITGRTAAGGTKKDKKGELQEKGVKKKVTVVDKAADAGATVFGTLLARYLIIAALFAGGGWGSVVLVQKITGYMKEETSYKAKKADQIKNLEVKARTAINEGRLTDAKKALDEMLVIDPSREMHRNFKTLQEQLEEAAREKK